jgi:transcription initiation factor IIE alpha subunit
MTIFDLPCQQHSETSRLASAKIAPTAHTLRQAVLRCLVSAGLDGLTDEEMQDRIPMQPSTQRPRRVELVRSGHVIDSGRKRETRSGRSAVVWVIAPPPGEQPQVIEYRLEYQI